MRFAVAALLLSVACHREDRFLGQEPVPRDTGAAVVPNTDLRAAGQPPPAMPSSGYEGNAWAISEGEKLFSWFNCTGCHANGGGGMGPPLMDEQWIYGSAPAQIRESIVKGRANGMPAWLGRIPDQQVWQLVAFVRSLSNLQPKAATPARSDHLDPASGQPDRTADDTPKSKP
jgi:cytochrome c oxidase cbb3-type subunit 3